MAKFIPSWRHWFGSSALAGVLSVGYWVMLGIIQIAPITQSDVKWGFFDVGALLSVVTWYALARASEKNAESIGRYDESIRTLEVSNKRLEESNEKLLRTLANLSPIIDRVVDQNELTHEQNRITHSLLGLNALYQVEGAIEGSGEMALGAPSISAKREVTITPAIGELVLEGHAPTISVQALNQQIKANEAEVLQLLDETDAWVTTAHIEASQRNAQEAAARTAAAVQQMQSIVNSGGTEFPIPDNTKPDETAKPDE